MHPGVPSCDCSLKLRPQHKGFLLQGVQVLSIQGPWFQNMGFGNRDLQYWVLRSAALPKQLMGSAVLRTTVKITCSVVFCTYSKQTLKIIRSIYGLVWIGALSTLNPKPPAGPDGHQQPSTSQSRAGGSHGFSQKEG